MTLRDVKPSDLIEHYIDFKPNTRLSYSKIPRYTEKKRQFVTVFFQKWKKLALLPKRRVIGVVGGGFRQRKKGQRSYT